MKLFLIRHGEAEDDLDDAYGGAADFRLTENGRDQAREVADKLAGVGIKHVYGSPLLRAKEAAEIIAERLGLPHTTIPELRERNSYGVLSGLSKERGKQLFGYILAELKEKPGYSREPLLGAEDFDEFIARVRRAFEDVTHRASEAGYDRFAIVTHGKFTQGLFEEVLRIKKNVYLDLSAINVVDYEPPRATLDRELVADAPHV